MDVFPCFDDVINLMLAFLTNTVPFFSYLSKFCCFDTLYEKACHSRSIYQKETNSWQWIDKYADLS